MFVLVEMVYVTQHTLLHAQGCAELKVLQLQTLVNTELSVQSSESIHLV